MAFVWLEYKLVPTIVPSSLIPVALGEYPPGKMGSRIGTAEGDDQNAMPPTPDA